MTIKFVDQTLKNKRDYLILQGKQFESADLATPSDSVQQRKFYLSA